jgi:ATP-dependent RNA helicase SUPV3L1/SUV3
MDDADPTAAHASATLAERAPVASGPTGKAASPLPEAAVARRLAALARARQDVPATPADLETAAALLLQAGPAEAPPDGALLDALRDAACARLSATARQSPDAAFAQAAGDVEALTGRAPTLPAIPELAAFVARAAGLDPAAAKAFGERLAATERDRRAAVRAARARARELHDAERLRLREWESELVGAEALPAFLGVPRPQVDRWIADGLIPVARSTPVRRGRRRFEELEFHPDQIAALRPQVAQWRARSAEREHEPAGARPRVPNGVIARRAGLDRYAAHFVNARSLQRRLTVVIGPTNSGKSHYALDRLAAAESGAALAPLRLLALEFQEALAARGVAASLLTGEERDIVPGARHVACTVEMADTSRIIDVAVVDEAQMLADPDRGAAWTAAIMGVPAREVIVLGAPDCLPLVRRIAELCDEPVEVVRLQRKNPLRVAADAVGLSAVTDADAVVAFSRRDIFLLRERLMARGRRVAVIYGNLGPEVRRAESRRFREGDAPVLVATDAIGMGLNLLIRRVVFSSLVKWDGREERLLTPAEVRQIGGRAGRYGQHEAGIVAVLAGGGDPARLRKLMETDPAPADDQRPLVSPDRDIVAAVAEELGTASLSETLRRIRRAVLRPGDPNYRLADLGVQIDIAAAMDGAGLPLLDRWTYALCPVDTRDDGVERLLRWGLDHAAGIPVPPPAAGHLPAPDRATQPSLEHTEKVAKRLVAWRWLSQRFPAAYPDTDAAQAERRRLNSFIEEVLRKQTLVRGKPVRRPGGPRQSQPGRGDAAKAKPGRPRPRKPR